MKIQGKKILSALLCLVTVAALFLPALTVLAADALTVTLPGSIRLTGDVPAREETYTVVLTAADDAPMPAGAKDGVYELEVDGEASFGFAIIYDKVGVYKYTIEQIEGDNSRCTYDDTVYYVTVSITNKEDGTGLESTVVMREADDVNEKKQDAADFVNRYRDPWIPIIPPPETEPPETKPDETEPPETDPVETEPVETDPPETEPIETEPEPEPLPEYKDITVHKVWVDDGVNRPESVNVNLIVDDMVIATATLSEENDWTYVWKNLVLAEELQWTVEENPVPGKYIVTYDYDADTATVTNTLTVELIQTGQLNWPIPLLSILGVIFLGGGVCLLVKKNRKQEEND